MKKSKLHQYKSSVSPPKQLTSIHKLKLVSHCYPKQSIKLKSSQKPRLKTKPKQPKTLINSEKLSSSATRTKKKHKSPHPPFSKLKYQTLEPPTLPEEI
jgi:hypothetical protein